MKGNGNKYGYGVCCCFLNSEYGYGNDFLVVRNIFRFMSSMSRFFTKKPRVFFGGFFRRAKQEDGGFWTSRFRWSSCLGENTLEGGRAPVVPANARTLSSQSSRTVRGCIAVAEVARFVQYTPSVLPASCLEKRFNRYKTLNHPSAHASAFSASRLERVSVPRSACLLATLPRCAGLWAGLRGRDSAHRTPWRDYH
jgi:hypothetical protein